MSYVVLARKWRPMTFSDLVGQEHVAKTLGNAIKLDRVAHAFLFTGVRGVGKTTSARILAKALNCEKGPTVTPCLECPQCTEIALGTDMDVQEIDAASRTGVDDIRELQETLAYRPSRDRFKIFIVDEVHMLSNSAWNAFLKTLEEPPPHVKFIFATTEVTKVPVTILSRCQRYDFKMIDVATIRGRLAHVLKEEGISAEDGALSILAREAAGSMRDGMSLLDQVIAWSGGEEITTAAVARALGVAETSALIGLVQSLVSGDAAKCLETVQALTDSGHDVAHLSRDILGVLRDLVVARVAPGSRGLLTIPDADLAQLESIANAAPSADDLSRLHLVFAKATEEILESPLPRASLEMALVRAARRPPLLAIDDLLRRLGELEGRLESARTGAKRETGTKPRAKPAGSSSDPEPGPATWEAPAPRLEAPAPRAEAPAPRVEAPSPRVEAPVPRAEAPVPPSGPSVPPSNTSRTPSNTSRTPPEGLPYPPSGPSVPEQNPSVPVREAPKTAHEFSRPGFGSDVVAPVFEIPKHILDRAIAAEAAASEFADEPEAGIVFDDDEDDDGGFAAMQPPPSRPPMSDRPPRSHRPHVPASSAARALAAMAPRGSRQPVRDAKAPVLYEYARFVDLVRVSSSRVSSLLERVGLLDFTAGRLSILVDPTSFEGTFLVELDSVRIAEDALRATFGSSATLELVAGEEDEDDVPTLARLATQAALARHVEAGERVRNHPLVTTLVKALGAEIKDVRLAPDDYTETLVQMLDRLRAQAS